MRYDLTISAGYVDEWDIWCGVREILQNAKDEEDKNDHKMVVKYKESSKTLKIENCGAFLEKRVLLTGFSDKRDDKTLRGMYGEGLKLGTIALLRCGLSVRIRNGAELWLPKFCKSKKFGDEKILSFNTFKRKDCGGVLVEIVGLEKKDWEDIKGKVLFIDKPIDFEKTHYGCILKEEKYRGKIFVKDLFVESKEGYNYGYNLINVSTDRDRKMVSSFDLKWELAKTWEEASRENKNILSETFSMLLTDSNDTEGFGNIYISDWFSEKICNRFVDIYGRNAFPVTSQDEADSMSHLGKHGIIVPNVLQKILQDKFSETVKESFKKAIKKEYSESELCEEARNNLKWVRNLISKVNNDGLSLQELVDPWVRIVDFYDKATLGKFSLEKQRIFISRSILLNKKNLLNAMVEEIAHMTLRSHGHFDFKMAIHDIYSLIILESGI